MNSLADPRIPGSPIGLALTARCLLLRWPLASSGCPLPSQAPDGLDLWDAICRAVGLPNANAPLSAQVAGQPASQVAWTAETRRKLATR